MQLSETPAAVLPPAATAAMYSRGALLTWANESLGATFASLDAIPAKSVALLLNAIYGHSQFPLNKIEFSDQHLPEAQLRNCEVIVSQAASALGYEGRLDPKLWHAKEDTANELLFWRWMRQSAEALKWKKVTTNNNGSSGCAVAPLEGYPAANLGEPYARRPPRTEDSFALNASSAISHANQATASLPSLQTPSVGPPLSRDAAAYHRSMVELMAHLKESNGVVGAGQQQQYTSTSSSTADASGVSATGAAVAAPYPTDPYVAALIDAKNDRLLFLQSLRQRLMAACHAKDRSKVMEVMCEYLRGGGVGSSHSEQREEGATARLVL